MKLTAKERYGVRAMASLAATYGVGPVALTEVASSQRIPARYLEHIAQALKKAGLIKSRRGVAGGYELARAPESISVADILRALEGSVLVTECGVKPICSYSDAVDACVSRPLWEALQRQVETSLNNVTLAAVAKSLRDGANVERTNHG